MNPFEYMQFREKRDMNPMVLGGNVGPPSAIGGIFDPAQLATSGAIDFEYFQQAGIFNIPNPFQVAPFSTPSAKHLNPPQDDSEADIKQTGMHTDADYKDKKKS